MGAWLIWWLTLEVIGVLALPITLRLFRFLPDRGLGFARQIGLLLGGYLFWLLAVLGILQNTTANIVFVFLALAGCSTWLLSRYKRTILATLRARLPFLVITEVLFFVALAGWALFRAYNPEIAYTEKPMEFGFINAILRSSQFPPADQWLSGFSISYYYFGYVLVAILTRLSGLPSDITFNLAGVTLFAFTVHGAFTLVYNMAQATLDRRLAIAGLVGRVVSRAAVAAGLLGSLFVALMGNLEGVFEVLRARGLGSAALWAWLDVRNLQATPPSSKWYPDDLWWWWRASRIIHDRDALGNSMEVISEFPFFSFILGDNHPHVLALPFVLLALGLALNLLLSIGRTGDKPRAAGDLVSVAPDDTPSLVSAAPAPVALAPAPGFFAEVRAALEDLWPGRAPELLLWALLLGSLGFLNTWDYPIYLGIFVLCYAVVRQFRYERLSWGWFLDVLKMGILLLALGLLLYAPFYLGFRSQAGGLGLTGQIKTRLHQFLLMFGVFIAAASSLLAAWVARWRRAPRERRALPRAALFLAVILAVLALSSALQGWWTATLLWVLIGVTAVLLLWSARPPVLAVGLAEDEEEHAVDASSVFALLALLAGLALALSVEFIFLQDSFGTRMNTVFKFYYQAWVLLGLVSAYGVFYLAASLGRSARLGRVSTGLALGIVALLTAAGLAYTVTATAAKANGFQGSPTLDGTRYVADSRPDDYAAVQWLRAHALPDAVMVEAPGGSYTDYNWVSAHTGIPVVLGWGGHELQWRGNYDEPGRREPDIATLYTTVNPATVIEILDKYGIDYVYLGPRERDKYRLGAPMVDKFDRVMVRAFEQGSVVIYARANY